MKEIIILGSTGSIGKQTLDIVREYPEMFCVVGMSCNSNVELFNKQIAEFKPKYVYVHDKVARSKCELYGSKMLGSSEELVSIPQGQIVVTAMVGISGLMPTIVAINNGKDIALANKETLVTGGDIVMPLAKQKGVNIFPVDSEHSAIWQCSEYGRAKDIKGLILTASGGAFRGRSQAELLKVTAKDALKHPTWNMGAKVTIDSSTLMNKGLEIIEAKHLFNMPVEKIEVVIHKQSIIHSLVTYNDNSVIAEMSYPDMRLPIQLALSYPSKIGTKLPELDLTEVAQLTFEKPDMNVFPCLGIAKECAKLGGLYPTLMNGANEIAVDAFLKNKIGFYDINDIISKVVCKGESCSEITLDSIIQADKMAREVAKQLIKC